MLGLPDGLWANIDVPLTTTSTVSAANTAFLKFLTESMTLSPSNFLQRPTVGNGRDLCSHDYLVKIFLAA
jgi:hypothetical protein